MLYCRTLQLDGLGEVCSAQVRVEVNSCRGKDMVESGGKAYIGSEVPKTDGLHQEKNCTILETCCLFSSHFLRYHLVDKSHGQPVEKR